MYLQDLVSDLPVRAEIDIGILPAGGLDLIQLDLLEGFLSGCGLFGFGSVCRKTGNEFLQLLDLLFLLLVGLLALLHQQCAGLKPEVIVSGIKLDLAIVDIGNVGADLIQEITVMGYHDDGILKVDQELLQPVDGIQIQMVGRLVQKQDVRIAKQGSSQQDLDPLRAVQAAHLGIVKGRIDTKAVQQCLCVGLRIPSVHLGKFGLQLAGLDAVLVGEVFLCIEGILLLHDLIQAGVAHDDGIQYSIGIVLEVILLQEGQTLARCDGHIAVRRLQLSGKDPQESGFSGAVGTDDAIAVSLGKFYAYVFKQGLFAHT